MMQDSTVEPKRVSELDALRGIAAIIVVLFHAFPYQMFFGWSAVDLFFVLSGYLITGIIIRHGRDKGFLRAFYARRILRIWPVYFVTLAAVMCLNALQRTGYPTDSFWQYLTFTQNAQAYWLEVPPRYIAPFLHSWSIAIEEQFYLVWPLLLLAGGKRLVVPMAIALLGATFFGRSIGYPPDILLGRGDGLAMGCLLAAILSSATAAEKARKLLPTLAAVSFAWILRLGYLHWADPEPRSFFAFALFYSSVVGIVAMHQGHRYLTWLRAPLFSYLGLISYSMYLFHLPVMHYAPPILQSVGLRSPVFIWPLIFGLPAMSYHFLEGPILSFKSRFPYSAQRRSNRPSALAVEPQ